MAFDPAELPGAFYRVSAKALIFDDAGGLLVFKDKNGEWEIPGGGWDYDESLEACLRRELKEEVGAEVADVDDPLICWRDYAGGVHRLKVAARVTLTSHELVPKGEDDVVELVEARYVAKEEFRMLPFQESEKAALNCIDKIWSEK